MLKRWLVIVAAVAALLPGAPSALDAPHDASFSDGDCNKCHALFVATPTGGYDYSAGCISCHNSKAPASGGFLWLDSAEAKPGVKGTSHSWTGQAVAPQHGAAYPTATSLSSKLVDGRLQCATCHDPHRDAVPDASSRYTSIPMGTAVDEAVGSPATTAQMTLVTAGTTAGGYRLKIQAGGASFVISHDFGLATPTWLNYVGGVWVAGTIDGPGYPFAPNVAVPTDDAAVTVRWSAAPTAGAYWDFYVGFPFLRMTNVDDTICMSCHKERFMDHVRSSGADATYLPNNTRRFSHPVGVTMNASGENYTRTVAVGPLDTNGAAQSSGDGRPSNDLVLDAGVVRCTTCHAVHNADSNSLTDDVR
jgi:hypothetical protein